MSDKKVVHYRKEKGVECCKIYNETESGIRYRVWPIDHTSMWVSNNQPAVTSRVVKPLDENGEFETLNSIYRPI